MTDQPHVSKTDLRLCPACGVGLSSSVDNIPRRFECCACGERYVMLKSNRNTERPYLAKQTKSTDEACSDLSETRLWNAFKKAETIVFLLEQEFNSPRMKIASQAIIGMMTGALLFTGMVYLPRSNSATDDLFGLLMFSVAALLVTILTSECVRSIDIAGLYPQAVFAARRMKAEKANALLFYLAG